MLLSVDWGNERDAGRRDIVGYILISMDMFFMVISFFCLFAVILVLRGVLTKSEEKELAISNDLTKISPIDGSNELSVARSKWGKFDHQLAVKHAQVEKTEEETQRSHDAAMKEVEEKGKRAHNRNTSNHSSELLTTKCSLCI